MKYLKTYENIVEFFIIFYKHTKNGVTIKDKYTTAFNLETALQKVEKLKNSFLSLDKMHPPFLSSPPKFDNWSLDNYWIEVHENNKIVKIINKDDIDSRFNSNKYNL